MESMSSRPINQLAESPHKTHTFCIPAYGYTRLVSPALLSFCSPFYAAYLHQHSSTFTTSQCVQCGKEHSATTFCLPYIYSPYELDFVLDFIEHTPPSTFPSPFFLSVLRLCDYLMLNHSFIFDMIQHYTPRPMRQRSPFTEALVDALRHTGYNRLGEEFANTYFHQDS